MPGPAETRGTTPPQGPDLGATWMLSYQAGDEAAFDRIVEGYSGRVFALLTRFLGPSEVREDLVQEVFLRVIRRRLAYRPEALFSTWLYRIVFNLCVNEGERRRPLGSLDDPRAFAAEREDPRLTPPGAELERADVVAAVRAAIAELPERQRMALILAKYEELSYDEVARVLGTSEKAVKSMIHRAREALRTRLVACLGEEVA